MSIFDDIKDEYQEASKAKMNASMEGLKETLKPFVAELVRLEQEKAKIDQLSKNLGQEIEFVTSEIRKTWEPFIQGAEKANLDIDGIELVSSKILNVSKENKDPETEEVITNWLLDNGYKDVMKYQIHHSTLKSMATKLFEESQIQIPGMKYTNFQKINVKQRSIK